MAMNHLNSVLLEGWISGEKTKGRTFSANSVLDFQITNRRYFRRGGEAMTQLNTVRIKAYGLVAERCESLEADREVRIIGRLETTENSEIIVIADHVEIKPGKTIVREAPEENIAELVEEM